MLQCGRILAWHLWTDPLLYSAREVLSAPAHLDFGVMLEQVRIQLFVVLPVSVSFTSSRSELRYLITAAYSICDLPVTQGTGSANLARWYYDAQTRSCKRFTYNGLKGNQNNFLTKGTCQASKCPCKGTKSNRNHRGSCEYCASVWQNPCQAPLDRSAAVLCTSGRFSTCPAGYWCHVGGTSDTTICCPGSS